jgi:predicted nucleotidyltransferase
MREHYNDALTQYPEHQIVGVFYQGSGNYGMDYEDSDVDTKCVIAPTIKQLVTEDKTSRTHIRYNDEHIDFKDVRIMLETFKKCNLNFLEILYTKYYIINPIYADEWNRLVAVRDQIVAMNPASLLKSMKGIVGEKYHALEHRYPSRIEWIDKFGYDPKQLHHLFRIKEFMCRWIDGEPFEKCLISCEPEWLIDVKKGKYNLDDARQLSKGTMDYIQRKYDDYLKTCDSTIDETLYKLFDEVIYNTIKIGITKELEINK